MRLRLLALGFLLVTATVWAQARLPKGWEAKGRHEEADGWLVATAPVTITVPLVTDTVTRLSLRLGQIKRPASCRVEIREGKPLDLSLSALDDEYRHQRLIVYCASLTFCLNPFQRGPVARQIGMLDRLVERDDDLKFSLGSLQGAQRFMNHGQGCST